MEEKEKQMWSIDDLVAMTETVQHAEVEYAGKILLVQWCELTESEEPKMAVPDDDQPAEDTQQYYKDLAQERVGRMIEKANGKNPDGVTLTAETWVKLPTTVRWAVSGKVLGGEGSQDFTTG